MLSSTIIFICLLLYCNIYLEYRYDRILNCSFSFLVLVSLKPAIKLLSQHAVALVNSSPREQFPEIMVDACPQI